MEKKKYLLPFTKILRKHIQTNSNTLIRVQIKKSL